MGGTQAEMQTLDRQRPRRIDGCTVERQALAAGAPVYILKDAAGRRYMRLTEEGVFLWRQIDGARTIRDLCAIYVAQVQRPAPGEALRALAQLTQAGFVTFATAGASGDAPPPAQPGALARLSSLCTRYAYLSDMDRRVSALYRSLRGLYTPLGQAALLVLAVAGAVAFAWHCAASSIAPAGALRRASLVWLASLALHVLVHEAAHALTCKHFGRAVHRVGVGWYYFAPVAFVDTSDMWAAARWPRILVSAVGPYANLVLSGIAALAASAPAAGGAQDILWSFSLIGYGLAAVNMNPLLELDGYYVLMDLLEIPNLRARALTRLGALRRGAAREELRRDRLVLLFGAASLAYGIAMAVGILFVSRAWIGALAGAWLPAACAHALGCALAGAMSLLVLYRLMDGVRATHGRS